MELKEIISVPGMSGLFRIVATNKNGFIVESLNDGKRTMVNNNQRIMTLTDISVYTKEGEMPLREVFRKLLASGKGEIVDPKGDAEKLRTFFKQAVPDYDEERVYASDIKKMINWYETLKDKIDFSKEEKSEDEEDVKSTTDHEKPIPKIHESHGPKTEQAKTSTAKTRKKV
jgi:hypothetical protein